MPALVEERPIILGMELLLKSAGIKLRHVPYSGASQAISDVVAGHVGAMFLGLSSVLPLAKDKMIKTLGIGSLERPSSARDIPTIAEQGLPGFEVNSWFGLFVPSGTPLDVIEHTNTAVNEILKNPEIKTLFDSFGLTATGGTPERLSQVVKADLTKWLKVMKDSDITPQ